MKPAVCLPLIVILLATHAVAQNTSVDAWIYQLGNSFDVITGQFAQQRVVNFTFKNGTTLQNPKNTSIVYDIPDQVFAEVALNLKGQTVNMVAYSAKEAAGNAERGLSVGIKLPADSFSFSASAKSAYSYLKERSSFSAFIDSTLAVTVFRGSLLIHNDIEATPQFQKDLARLPCAGNSSAYAEFIQHYGTHYLESAFFGGYGSMTVAVNAQEAQYHDAGELATQAGIQFAWFQFGVNGGGGFNESAKWFREDSQFDVQLHGGWPGLYKNLSDWNKWIESFWDYPTWVNLSPDYQYAIRPITDFVDNSTCQYNGLIEALNLYAKAHPMPTDPKCEAKIYCANTTSCCDLDTPICIPGGGCCAVDHVCGPLDSPTCCPSDTECCGDTPDTSVCCGGKNKCTDSKYGQICCSADVDKCKCDVCTAGAAKEGRCLSLPNHCYPAQGIDVPMPLYNTSSSHPKGFCFDGECSSSHYCCCLTCFE